MRENTFICGDCGQDTLKIGEYYMVKDEVWNQSKLPSFGVMLCISDLEGRIGRRLKSDDFTDAPCNSLYWNKKSARLRHRMGKLTPRADANYKKLLEQMGG